MHWLSVHLPDLREGLVSKYTLEKEEQLQANANKDYVKKRKTENFELFIHKVPCRVFNDGDSLKKENILKEQSEKYSGRKR